jgi:dihydroorotate dehydrogenase (fumarate)
MADLSTVFAGIKLKNPIIIGSSGLSDSIENIVGLERAGAAAVVLKSLFEEEILKELNANMQRMSSDGFLYPETVDYYEQIDSPAEPTARYLDQIRMAKSAVKIPVIASINCITASQWTYFPLQIQQAGADAIELNIFVLPSDINRTTEENERVYFDIAEQVKKQVTIPVVVKLSYYFSNLASFLQKLSHSGISGLVLFNRYYNPDIDIDSLEFTSGGVLSSPSDLYMTLRWIGILSGRLGCSLCASTGIHDGPSLIKMLLTGANAVEIASTVYINGYDQIQIMLDELENWMTGKKLPDIESFRGMLSQFNTANPAAYERVQFMKYFRGFRNL